MSRLRHPSSPRPAVGRSLVIDSPFRLVPFETWPEAAQSTLNPPRAVWKSREFLVQVYPAGNGADVRLSVNRCWQTASGEWGDQITWDELQRIKRECGYGDHYAVEIFPADRDIVNVANMRHLWVLASPPSFGFGGRKA